MLFAGDPQQLAPIVLSQAANAREWLGRSPFDLQTDASPAVKLNEQSRMHAHICTLVSELFYGGDLIVADAESVDPKWKAERRVLEVPSLPGKNRLVVHRVETPGQWDPRMKSNDRAESSDWVAATAAQLVEAGTSESDILVLTPYRAQRVRIRERLRDLRLRDVHVSTVHRAQGSERHTVIFDVTKADNPFLRDRDAWRLVNVAISRAKARIILPMSDWDRTTPIFELIAWMIENDKRPSPIERLALKPRFPESAERRWVSIWGERDREGKLRHVVGKVLTCPDGPRVLRVQDALTGETIDFNAPRLQTRARSAATAAVG